jgi:hypothetical protein
MVYVVVLAAGLYYAAMDPGCVVPVEREAADRRWLARPGLGRMLLGLWVRIGLFAAAALDPSGNARLLFVLVPFAPISPSVRR